MPRKQAGQLDPLLDKAEKLKAGSRAKVEHTLAGDQAAVRPRENSLPGPEEERRAGRHVVCVVCVVQLMSAVIHQSISYPNHP